MSTQATSLSKASFKLFKSFGVYTWDFKYPQRKKSNGFRSGDLAGQSCPLMALLVTTLPSTLRSRYLMLWSVTWHCAPSCCHYSICHHFLFLTQAKLWTASKNGLISVYFHAKCSINLYTTKHNQFVWKGWFLHNKDKIKWMKWEGRRKSGK